MGVARIDGKGRRLHPHFQVDHLVLAAAGLLAAGIAMSRVADRLKLPAMLLFLGLGMAIGNDGLGWVHFDDAHLAQNLGIVALVLILFDGGLSSSPTLVRRVVKPAAVLATVGVAITAAIAGLAATYLLHTSVTTGLLMGSVVASTDAAAVFSVLRKAPLPARLGALIETESGGNDPTAVMLTVGMIAVATTGATAGDWIVFGLRQLVGGLLVGAVVGLLASRLFIRASSLEGSIAPLLGLTAAAACYGIATWAGASGFLAVYVGGIIVGSVEPAHRQATMAFHDGLARLAQLFMFLLLGLLVFPSQLGPVALKALAVAAVLTFVARPVAVWASLAWFRMSTRELAIVSWAGLRGAVPIVLATFPLTAGVPAGGLIFDVAFFVVLISALVQGSTVGWVAERLGLRGEPTPWSAIVDVVPIDLFGVELVDVELGPQSPAVGREIRAVPLPGDARIVTVMRGGRVTVPTGHTVLGAGDRLAIAAPSANPSRDQLSAWAGDPSG